MHHEQCGRRSHQPEWGRTACLAIRECRTASTGWWMLNLCGSRAQSRRKPCSICPVAMLNLARNTHIHVYNGLEIHSL